MLITVVGAGPGAAEFFTEKMIRAAKEAEIILTSERLSESMKALNSNVKIAGVTETLRFIEENAGGYERICVAATGDTGFYSIAAAIGRCSGDDIHTEYICGISSMQYFAAVTKHGYEKMKLVSLHGKIGSLVPFVTYNKSVFALTGGMIKAGDIIKELDDAGLREVTVYAGENLTLENERILSGIPSALAGVEFGDLTVMIVDNPDAADKYEILGDEDFVRGGAPMTKESVRNLSIAELAIRPEDIVYDIGAGTGAMTCALALKASESFVYAVEKKSDAAGLIRANMDKLGIRNIKLKGGNAPECMQELPPADKVFIGGSSGNLREIIDSVFEKNKDAVILVTAVTLETLNEATELFGALELKMTVKCINISQSHKLGRYDLMKAENPVYLIKGERNDIQ